ncbi:Mur ligase [Actinomyces oris]|nr:Mur ligase [Actinomyces oris]
MERTDPGFLERTLGRLPRGVIVVSGTNGKTTTTKMVVQLLREQGLKVFTNRTGSNFVRGVLASLLTEVDAAGNLDADIAILELDEAHAVHFVARVRPRACLLLNVMRDQLDRFGEIDYTASLLHSIAQATSDVVVLNGDDPRLAAPAFLEGVSARVVSFGAGEDLRSLFLSDDDLRTGLVSPRQAGQAPGPRVTLEAIDGQRATVRVDGVSHEVDFTIPGVHNLLNACAALGVVLEVLGEDADLPGLLTTLGTVQAAFGRGEVLTLDGRPIQLSLVKNPAGFRMGLLSAASQAQDGEVVVVAINDEYADGRDMSWLWDVDFSALRAGGVAVVTGVRAWDMALRLRYDEVEVAEVEPDLRRAVALMRRVAADTDRPMRIFTTYTAMLALRSILGEMTDVEEVMS